MMNVAINLALLIPILGTAYFFWVRPILKQTPSLKEFWDNENNFFEALKLKFAGIKQKIAGAVIIIAGIVVEAYNFIGPALGTVDMSGITDKVPSWAWPLVTIACVALLNYFRKLSDTRAADEDQP
jgi:hypothetical protein